RIRGVDWRIACRRRGYGSRWSAVERCSQKSGKISISLCDRRNRGRDGTTNQLPRSLIVHKEKCFVVNDGAAYHKSKLIAAELRLVRVGRRCPGEQVAGIQHLDAQNLNA